MLQLNEAFVRNKMKLNDKCYRNGKRSIVLITYFYFQYFKIIDMLINELIGNYYAKVYWANTGMLIWDPSICHNDTHPRFNFHLELFLYLKWQPHDIELRTKTHWYYVKKADIITITKTFPHVAHMGLMR